MCTETPKAAASGSRRLTSRQPSVGACSTRPNAGSTMPGTTTPTPSTSADFAGVCEHLLDASRQFLRQHLDVFAGLKTADDAQLFAHQIRNQDVGARGANVDADDATLARVDVQESGTAPASDGFADSAFEDQRLAEQLADEQACDAAADVHQAGQVGAGDRLMGANEIQSNLPVDFAAGPTPGDREIVWIDLAHRICT